MSHCPHCNQPLPKDAAVCPGCQAPLDGAATAIPKLTFSRREKPALLQQPALLRTFFDSTELELARGILMAQGIACFVDEGGATGGLLRIYTGRSPYGQTLYVEQAALAEAAALLDAYCAPAGEPSAEPED